MQGTSVRRWTRAEFDRMVEIGILSAEERLELLDGEIVQVTPQGKLHASAIRRTQAALTRAFGEGYIVQVQLPLAPDSWSEPEPDLAVLRGAVSDFDDTHPETAILVVEVAETSLEIDRTRKGSLYARARFPEYWIVNLPDRQLEVYRTPMPDARACYGWQYGEVAILSAGDSVAPLEKRDAVIEVVCLFPEQRRD